VCAICMKKGVELFLSPKARKETKRKADLRRQIEEGGVEILQEQEAYVSAEQSFYQLLSYQLQLARNQLEAVKTDCQRLAEQLEEERRLREEETEAANDMQSFVESIELRLRRCLGGETLPTDTNS